MRQIGIAIIPRIGLGSEDDIIGHAIVHLCCQIPVGQGKCIVLCLLQIIRVRVVLTVFLELNFVPFAQIWVSLRLRVFSLSRTDLLSQEMLSLVLSGPTIERSSRSSLYNPLRNQRLKTELA